MQSHSLYRAVGENQLECGVCPRRCRIDRDGIGYCRVRKRQGDEIRAVTYGRLVSETFDPIEKKPLYHFAPGSRILSVATRGCNFRCSFCQNYRIAIEHEGIFERERSPQALAADASTAHCSGIAFTYTEPTISIEYFVDTMRELPDNRAGVFVSNGYMTPEAATILGEELDAINVDIKGDDAFYKKYCGVADPSPIYTALEILDRAGVHIEITNLILPGENDDPSLIRDRMRWIKETLGPNTPVHFSRFHPAYKLTDLEPTPVETLKSLMEVAADEGLSFVYAGNIPSGVGSDTCCPGCDREVIVRRHYDVVRYAVDDGYCSHCGTDLHIRAAARATPR